MTPWTLAYQTPLSADPPGKNSGVGCLFLLHGIFLTQGSNPSLWHWQADSLPLSHQGDPAARSPPLQFCLPMSQGKFFIAGLQVLWRIFKKVIPEFSLRSFDHVIHLCSFNSLIFPPSENSKLLSMSFCLSLLAPPSKILPHVVLTGKLVWEILPLSLYFVAPSDLVPSYLPRRLFPQFFSCVCLPSCFSRVWLFATLWTVAHQAPLSMGFSRQEYWSGLPCPPPGHLPNPGIEPTSLLSPALAGGFCITGTTWEVRTVFWLKSFRWIFFLQFSQ